MTILTLLPLSIAVANRNTSDSVVIKMYKTTKQGQGQYVGTIIAKDSQYGLLLIPNLHNLPAGEHGFHVHVNPSCADNGLAAGGHLDPTNTGHHFGPYNPYGHLGDLPPLYIHSDGRDTLPILAPRLTVADIRNHALMIHVGGDNYSDTPEKLGGGGVRIACGVIAK
ncbi:MAG: superoxide dismutase family protein [Gammaproteobacteria bacterium]|nr:superoxide dismutase family protein [Gammaproteobacteria bacterium]